MIELFHRGIKCVKIGMDKKSHNIRKPNPDFRIFPLTHVKADLTKKQGEVVDSDPALVYIIIRTKTKTRKLI
jgi:hypothetical protein